MSNKPNFGKEKFKKKGIHIMSEEKKNEVTQQQNQQSETAQQPNPAPEPVPAKMTKAEGFWVKHAETLDKWTGRIVKGVGIVAGAAGVFALGVLAGRGSRDDQIPSTGFDDSGMSGMDATASFEQDEMI